MISLKHRPSAPLSGFIDHLWLFSDAPLHTKERIVPSGTLELVINLDEDEFRIYDPIDVERCKRFSGVMVSGAYRGFFVIDTREHASVMGVHFKPGGALPFLGAPPGAFADTHVDLEVFWGRRRAGELRERLCAAVTPAHRFQILEEALLERLLHRPVRRHGAVQAALHHLGHGRSVREVAEDLNLSQRRFIEVFTAEIGLTPKLFARVRRFQRALALAAHAPPVWSQLALDCGFFDQAHMIRDFVDFSGFSPAELLRHRSEHIRENHLALAGDGGSNSSNTPASSG